MIEENINLAYFVLNKFNLAFDNEALSYALEGLFLASKTYDGKAKFSTYAHVCIYNKVCEYLRIKYKTDTPVEQIFDEGLCDDSLEIRSAIDYVLNSFSGTKRTIIDTWFETDFNQRSTASVTGYSTAYINKTVLEFRSKLKIELED